MGLTPLITHAENDHHLQADAHIHGVATLNWVLEGPALHMALQSPMMDVLGFEHKPNTNDEKLLFSALIANLNNKNKVVDLTGGDCELTTVNIVNPFEEEESSFSHKSNHSEITAEYEFLCQQPSQLEAININLFDTFPGFKVINAQWIVDGKQGGARLNHDHHLVKVR